MGKFGARFFLFFPKFTTQYMYFLKYPNPLLSTFSCGICSEKSILVVLVLEYHWYGRVQSFVFVV